MATELGLVMADLIKANRALDASAAAAELKLLTAFRKAEARAFARISETRCTAVSSM